MLRRHAGVATGRSDLDADIDITLLRDGRRRNNTAEFLPESSCTIGQRTVNAFVRK